jgi:zinc transporter, ZIP family
VGEAVLWGFIGASSLILGALLTVAIELPRRVVGLTMAFGAGVLLSAVAYELVQRAVVESSALKAGIGVGVGALTFFAGDMIVSRRGGGERKDIGGGGAEGSAVSIVLGTLLDGIPESFILGLSVSQGTGISVAYLAAVFLSNLPEAIGASAGLLKGGWSRSRLLGMWFGIAVVSAGAAGLGYLIFSDLAERDGAIVLAFAGGAVLTMLASTMIPEAYEEGGKLVGIVTVLGFMLAILLSSLE